MHEPLEASEGRVLIIQSKYRGSEKAEDHEDVSHFANAVVRMHEAYKNRQKLNRKVMEAISEIDWDSDYFEMHFISLGKASDAIRNTAGKGPHGPKDLVDFADRSELNIFDEHDLNLKLREALSAGEVLDQTVDIKFAESEDAMPWLRYDSQSGRSLYIGEITGAQLAEMYRQYKYKLFAMNIRDYVGESSTNKGIVSTAINRPDEFLFFNNGISAVATDIQPDEDNCILKCRRFSIINGAQTVRSLSKAQVRNNLPVRDVRVLLRVMDFSLSKDSEFLTDVTRFNNTQNSVKISDFRSNDVIQKDLHRRFSDISRNGKVYFYKNKRSREAASNRIPISMEDFAKAIHAFRFGPDEMYGGTKYLFETSAKGGYLKVFGDPVSHCSDEEFSLLAGTYFIWDHVGELWKQRREKDYAEGKASGGLERRWLVFYAVGQLLRMSYSDNPDQLNIHIRRLSNPSLWLENPTHTTRRALLEIFKLVATSIAKTYNTASRDMAFRHRNWFRTESTLREIDTELSVIPEYRPNDMPVLLPKTKAAATH